VYLHSYGLSYKYGFSISCLLPALAVIRGGIIRIWFAEGQKGSETLLTYSSEADLGGHLVYHVFG
jgi:hypothetical protein